VKTEYKNISDKTSYLGTIFKLQIVSNLTLMCWEILVGKRFNLSEDMLTLLYFLIIIPVSMRL